MIDWKTRAPVDEDEAVDGEVVHGNRVLERLQALRDAREQGWGEVAQPILFVAIGVGVALLVGVVATIVVVGPQTVVRSGSPRGTDGAVAGATQVVAAPADVVQPILIDEPSTATELPTLALLEAPTALPTVAPTTAPSPVATARPTVAPTAAPTPVPTAAPTTAPTANPTSVPTSVPTTAPTRLPSADDAWPATLLALEPVWSTDPPRATALLDDFLARFPNYPPAVDKEYAALVASGEKLAAAGNVDGATSQLTRARDMDPDRVEAPAALRALAPPPAEVAPAEPEPMHPPAEAAPVEPAPAPPPAPPAPRAVQPTPVPRVVAPQERPPAPPPPPPTPTKIPFRPPNG